MKLRIVAEQLYCDFVVRFHDLQSSEIKLTQNQRDIVTDFLIELHKNVGLHSVGPRYIYDFLIYQFNYWHNKKVKFGDRITVVRVLGKKSIRRWFDRREDFSWYNAYKDMSQYGLTLKMLSKFKQKKLTTHIKLSQFEEQEKKRFYNTQQGFRNCIEQTTLYNHKSKLCAVCINNRICKQLLKANYPAIYIDRGCDRKS